MHVRLGDPIRITQFYNTLLYIIYDSVFIAEHQSTDQPHIQASHSALSGIP